MKFRLPPLETINVNLLDVLRLDALLFDSEGDMRALPAEAFTHIPHELIRAWCTHRGRYCVLTWELICWLRERIAGKKALEICAGCGDLGFYLGIPMTDSYQQVNEPETVKYLAQYRQQPTVPRREVRQEDAENAVRKRRPDVVIGAWVTEQHQGGECGNMFGPREDYILERCGCYIMIGNEAIHGKKRLLALPHETHQPPWLVSRAKDQTKNVIYVWPGKAR